jgi:hypothetical protein
MLLAIILPIILAFVAAVVIELVKRPFRSAWAWARRWAGLIRQLPRLDLAVENLAWMIAGDEADCGSSAEEHRQAVQDLHDFLTGRRDADGLRRRPRGPFG